MTSIDIPVRSSSAFETPKMLRLKPLSEEKATRKIRINKQIMNFSTSRNFPNQLSFSKTRQKCINKAQMLKTQINRYFPEQTAKVLCEKQKRTENLGYKLMMRRLRRSKQAQIQNSNIKKRNKRQTDPIQPSKFITAHKIKPKLQIEGKYNFNYNEDLAYFNFNSPITRRANSDLSFYNSMTSYLLQGRKRNEQIVCDLRPKINKNPQLFFNIEPWQKVNDPQEINY